MDKKIGHYSFIVGVLVAIVLGLALPVGAQAAVWLTSLLIVLGLIVGFLNVTGKETSEFLTVATILVIVSFAGNASGVLEEVQYIGAFLKGILNSILLFVVPATIVVALKDIVGLAKN